MPDAWNLRLLPDKAVRAPLILNKPDEEAKESRVVLEPLRIEKFSELEPILTVNFESSLFDAPLVVDDLRIKSTLPEEEARMLPVTVNFCSGDVSPMPTLPLFFLTNKVLPMDAVPDSSRFVVSRSNENPPLAKVKLASKVIEFTNSSKSRELDATPAVAQERVPEPSVRRNLFDSWVVGHVYVTPRNVVAPDMEAVPPTSNMVLMTLPELMPRRAEELVSSRLPDMEALEVNMANPSKADEPLTSKPPETRRSSNELTVPE